MAACEFGLIYVIIIKGHILCAYNNYLTFTLYLYTQLSFQKSKRLSFVDGFSSYGLHLLVGVLFVKPTFTFL